MINAQKCNSSHRHGIADSIGGLTSLAAVSAIIAEVIGAVLATPLLNRLEFQDWRVWR